MKNIKHGKKQYFHEDFLAFNRTELPSLSFLWLFYGFLNYFWIKSFLAISSLFGFYISCKIHFYNRDVTLPYSPKDKIHLEKLNKIFVKGMCIFLGLWTTEIDLTQDEKVLKIYRKYLGEDYNPDNWADKYTTVISNHISHTDILYLGYKLCPCYCSKESVKNIPMVGYISQCYKTVYIDRTGGDNSRLNVAKKVEKRQIEKLEGKSIFAVCICPEGTATNGRCIITFKKGAFHSLTPVKPFIFKADHRYGKFPISTAGIDMLIHMFITCTFLKIDMEAKELPVFAPNEYLFENYKNLGKDKVEVYSETVRLIMGEIGQIPLNNSDFKTKLDYISIIKGKTIKNT